MLSRGATASVGEQLGNVALQRGSGLGFGGAGRATASVGALFAALRP